MAYTKQKKENQMLTAITPLETGLNFEDIFYTLCITKKHKYISFLDSSLVPNRFSGYSYLAWEPEFVVKSSGIKNEAVDLRNGLRQEVNSHPLKFLEQVLKKNIFTNTKTIYFDILKTGRESSAGLQNSSIFEHCSNMETGGRQKSAVQFKPGHSISEQGGHLKTDIDFGEKMSFNTDGKMLSYAEEKTVLPDYKGGFIGYFSYDLKNYIERLPSQARKDLKVPVFYLCYYLKFLAFNHQTGRCYLIKNFSDIEYGKDNSFANSVREDMLQEKEKIIRLLKHRLKSHSQKINDLIIEKYKARQIGNPELTSNFLKPDYIRAVIKTKEHIHNGDIYQANISQRFSCSINVDPADLYYILRQKNSAPFSAFLGFPGLKVGCSSPERFMFLKDRQVETRPIKGTRPRGRTKEEDNRYIKELQESLKDHAELNMIVDLERNDLGRFCKYGTVRVEEHAVIEKYAKVFHLVSTVTGLMQEGYSHIDIIKAAFPGGSITGAPKIRAMEIIDSLEPTARNIYTGSMGYISINGTMDLNIAIRTFIIKNKKFYYNVGGGIVEDSVPESEYLETLDKGAALKETLEFFSQKNLK